MKTKQEMLTEFFPNQNIETKWYDELRYWWLGSLWWLFPKGILQENPVIFLTNPFVSFPTVFRHLKWAWQRVYRGWDDTAAWSVDYWLDDVMPDILKQLKKYKQGTPICFFPSDYSGDDEYAEKAAREKWNTVLDKMILGFESSKKLEDTYNDEEIVELNKKMEEGLLLFVKHYKSLWD